MDNFYTLFLCYSLMAGSHIPWVSPDNDNPELICMCELTANTPLQIFLSCPFLSSPVLPYPTTLPLCFSVMPVHPFNCQSYSAEKSRDPHAWLNKPASYSSKLSLIPVCINILLPKIICMQIFLKPHCSACPFAHDEKSEKVFGRLFISGYWPPELAEGRK